MTRTATQPAHRRRRGPIADLGALAAAFGRSRPTARIDAIYQVIGTTNLFTDSTRFMNLGYWKDAPLSLDDACRDLARLVARAAAIGAGDTVLDVGNGYGDQDALWLAEYGPERLVGVNVSRSQAGVARTVMHETAPGRGSMTVASAPALPFRPAAFTKVVALESAFHFPSRARFFAEAYRLLTPGGRLVTADVVLRSAPTLSPRARAAVRFLTFDDRLLALYPAANWVDAETYQHDLRAAGFGSVGLTSISADVFEPLIAFLQVRSRDPRVRDRVHPVMRAIVRPRFARLIADRLDYVVAVARKPAAGPGT